MIRKPPASKKPRSKPANKASELPRLPRREQGRLRFEILVDTADRLLEQHSAGELSLYDIAKAAGVPAASVYHFFPSMTAAVVAVAQRYLQTIETFIAEPLDHDALISWRDIFRIKGGQGCAFYDTHPVARRLFLGSEYTWQVRMADIHGNESYARLLAEAYARHFEIQASPWLIHKVEIAIGLSDSALSLSCLRHDVITDEYAIEAQRAFHSYLGGFIPEFAPKRSAPAS